MRVKYFIFYIFIFLCSIGYSQDYEWSHDRDIVYVNPIALGSGSIRNVTNNAQIVKGEVSIGIQCKKMDRGAGEVDYTFPTEMKYQFFFHQPDDEGKDVSSSLSSVLTGPNTETWNSNSIADGVYALSIRIYSAGLSSDSDISRFRTRPLIIIVDNNNIPLTGAQWIPSTGSKGMRSRNYDGTAIDWIWYPGWSLPISESYIYNVFTPPNTEADREQLARDNLWFTETLWGSYNSRYDNISRFARTEEGHVIIDKFHVGGANSSKTWAQQYYFADGLRNQGGIIGPSTLIANARGRGVVGATYGDRVFYAGPDGISTIAGFVTESDVLPGLIGDLDESTAADLRSLIGNFNNDELFSFSKQSELVFDPFDKNKIYISDTGNHRIALLEVNGADSSYSSFDTGYPKVSTFAGSHGNAGNANGGLTTARFNNPCGMVVIDNMLYIADRGNKSIRAINLIDNIVSTIDNSTFSDPYVVRRTSDKNLVVKSGQPIYFYNLSNGSSYEIVSGGKDDRMGMEVDWRGNFGPVDDVLWPGEDSDHHIGRISIDGTNRIRMIRDEGNPQYYTDAMGGSEGSYALQIAIDDEEARLFGSYTYRGRPIVHRPLKNDDPINIDRNLSQKGKYIYHFGTVLDFNQHWQRPSFASIHGTTGHHWLGNTIPTFDELALMTNLELAEYIKNGMAGNTERPEITGKDLQAIMYYVKVLSVQGKTKLFTPQDILEDLAGSEFWPDVNDYRSPMIYSINVVDAGEGKMQVEWTTDELTLGVISYGTSRATISYRGLVQEDVYGLFSEIETTYSESHSLILENIPAGQEMKFIIISKDKAGNIGKSREMRLVEGSSDEMPPDVPRGLNITR